MSRGPSSALRQNDDLAGTGLVSVLIALGRAGLALPKKYGDRTGCPLFSVRPRFGCELFRWVYTGR